MFGLFFNAEKVESCPGDASDVAGFNRFFRAMSNAACSRAVGLRGRLLSIAHTEQVIADTFEAARGASRPFCPG